MELTIFRAAHYCGEHTYEVDDFGGDATTSLLVIDPGVPDEELFSSCLYAMACRWSTTEGGSPTFLKKMGEYGKVCRMVGGAVFVHGAGWTVLFSNDEIVLKERALLRAGKYAEASALREPITCTEFKDGRPV